MGGNTVFRSGFFDDDGFDFETRVVLGQVAYGAADAGEVLATIAGIEDGNAASWIAAWCALGDRLAAAAATCAANGHRVSAAQTWLRASVAYACTLNTLAGSEGTEALLPVFRKHRQAWSRFCELQQPAWQPIAIPYEGTTLPGWFATPSTLEAAGARRPTLILNNGSDGPISSMLTFGGAGALARGYNALFFDGPGQQSQLFEQCVHFRPDWEAVITPVVDFLLARNDVDPNAIALYGVSQGGYWVPRAISREHRLAAAIADTGTVDVSASWLRHLPPVLVDLLHGGNREGFNTMLAAVAAPDPKMQTLWNFRARPYGHPEDAFATFVEMLRYQLTPEDAARIRTPLLITDPEGEQFWPGQAEQLAAMTPKVSTLLHFTAAEGANFHCEPMARKLVDQRMFDWLDGQFGR